MTELITKEGVKNRLNISLGKIDKMMRMNEIPYYKIGKSVRFDIDERVNPDIQGTRLVAASLG